MKQSLLLYERRFALGRYDSSREVRNDQGTQPASPCSAGAVRMTISMWAPLIHKLSAHHSSWSIGRFWNQYARTEVRADHLGSSRQIPHGAFQRRGFATVGYSADKAAAGFRAS